MTKLDILNAFKSYLQKNCTNVYFRCFEGFSPNKLNYKNCLKLNIFITDKVITNNKNKNIDNTVYATTNNYYNMYNF